MSIKEIMKDKEFVNRFIAEYLKEKEEHKARNREFRNSQTFEMMVDAINAKGGRIDSEGFGYFPGREKASAGWELFQDSEILQMFNLCSEPESEFCDPGSVWWDLSATFPTCRYTVAGLRISWMTGQGTSIMIQGNKDE